MESEHHNRISYRRQGTRGTLTLSGVIDIFEATALREASCRALKDEKARSVTVDLTKTTHLDTSALQMLMALQRDLRASSRVFLLTPYSSAVENIFRQGGIPFENPQH